MLQEYALDFTTLAVIEAAVFAVLEYKRYENIKKTGVVRFPPRCYPLSFCSTRLSGRIAGAHEIQNVVPPAPHLTAGFITT